MKRLIVAIVLIQMIVLMFAVDYPEQLIRKQKEWSEKHPGELPIWLTPEEFKQMQDYGRAFYETDPPTGPVRNVAEFEPMSAVIIRYPLGIPYSLIREMAEEITVITVVENTSTQNQAISNYQNNNVNIDNCEFMIAPTDSYWTRDFSPWFIFDGNNELAVVNFPYNRPRPNDNDLPIAFANAYDLNLYGMNLSHTGGNYMSDGMGVAASTTLVWSENSNLSHAQVDNLVQDYLGITTYHVLEDPLADYIEHVDCWGKFLDVDKVLIGSVPQSDPRYNDYEATADYFANSISSYGTPYQVFRVYSPGGYSYATPYTNSLILNNRVFVPQTGSTHDAQAIEVYQQAMPGYEIIGIQSNGWYDTDALHCRTHEVADAGMLYVYHMPVQPEIEACETVNIETYIYPYSGAEVYSDSLLVFFKIEGENTFSSVLLNDDGDYFYSAEIPVVPGSDVYYYIHAADASGRSVNHPFIGSYDPHVFHVAEAEQDTIPPTILHDPIDPVGGVVTFESLPLLFTAIVTDNVAVAEVVYEIRIDGSDIMTYFFENTVDDVWEYYLGGENLFANSVVEYRIFAADNAEPANTRFYPQESWIVFQMEDVGSEDNLEFDCIDSVIGTYPNPFSFAGNSRTEGINIRFSLSESRSVTLSIFDIKGRLVNNLSVGEMAKGSNTVSWNVRDYNNTAVSSGIYFVKINNSPQAKAGKILIIK
ncbi:MAG: agmatine deiminase family protein [Candidatus Cloacimonetes bacterium]|nr:agmatine deiminase family protein [Candidatus Cloacimonadota bacterium]